MNFKTTYVLFGGLGLLLVALLGVMWLYKDSDDKENELLFPSLVSKDKEKARTKLLTAEDVTKVTIQRKKPAGDDIVIVKDGKDWKITSPRALRAEGQRVTGLIDAIFNARSEDKSKPKNLKEGGLDSPSRIITIEGKERVLTLTLGDVDLGTDGVAYATSSDRPKQPLAVSKRDVESALEDLGYFRAKELLGDNNQEATSIKISETKKGTVALVRDKGGRWRFEQPKYGDAAVDAGWLNNLSNLRVEYKKETDNDFVQDGVSDLTKIDKDLAKSDELRLEVGQGDKKTTVVVLIGKKVGEKYYAYVDEAGKPKDVVKVSAMSVEPFVKLLEDPSALRSKNLLALDAFRTPDAIDVTNDYGAYQFRQPEGSKLWKLYRDGKSITPDEQEVRLLIDALNRPNQVTKFESNDEKRKKELGLASPRVVVKVWSDSLEKSDAKKPDSKKPDVMPAFKKDVKPVTELRFGNFVGDSVAVERVWDGDSAVVLVPKATMEQLLKSPLAYFDRSVPPFAESIVPDQDVTKVEFTRTKDGKSETYELTRADAKSPWKIVKPVALKDRNGSEMVVREILMDVNRLPVKEVVAEKADKTDLGSKYGLASPNARVVVTVTKDKKDTKHEYDFGKQDGAKGTFAKVSGKDTIYLVDNRALEWTSREVRDTTVFSFDPSKVVAVKLSGWFKRDKEVVTRTLEKKEGKWVIKEKPTQTVDEAKVNEALAELSRLRATKFVSSGKGFDPKDDSLKIEVTLDDKTAVDLTLGAEDGDAYFASSTQQKGEAFLVPKKLFEEVRSSPVSFVK